MPPSSSPRMVDDATGLYCPLLERRGEPIAVDCRLIIWRCVQFNRRLINHRLRGNLGFILYVILRLRETCHLFQYVAKLLHWFYLVVMDCNGCSILMLVLY